MPLTNQPCREIADAQHFGTGAKKIRICRIGGFEGLIGWIFYRIDFRYALHNTLEQGQKKSAVLFCTALGFPVYNLMKSSNLLVKHSTTFCSFAAVSFI